MFIFIAILFILLVTFFIGQYVGKSVPDEIIPQYIDIALNATFLVMLGVLLAGYGHAWLAFLVVLLIPLRRFLLYAPLSGVVIGAALWVPLDFQITIFVCCLLLNFLLGTQKNLWRNALLQLGIALVFGLLSNV